MIITQYLVFPATETTPPITELANDSRVGMVFIDGEIVEGWKRAQMALAVQLPIFVRRLPDLAGCYPGTINVQLDEALYVQTPDLVTPPIRWTLYRPEEHFSFLEITFESPVGTTPRRAWIYIPSGSPHFQDVHHIEVITQFLPIGAEIGTRCRIRISKQHTMHDDLIVI